MAKLEQLDHALGDVVEHAVARHNRRRLAKLGVVDG
jgi:hypothetical protein